MFDGLCLHVVQWEGAPVHVCIYGYWGVWLLHVPVGRDDCGDVGGGVKSACTEVSDATRNLTGKPKSRGSWSEKGGIPGVRTRRKT